MSNIRRATTSTARKSSPAKPATKRSSRKPARKTKLAKPVTAAKPAVATQDRWTHAAMRLEDDSNPLSIPYTAFLDEARQVASVLRRRWMPAGDTPGFVRVHNVVPESTADDIGELIEAVQAAHTTATLAVTPPADSDLARAEALITELASALNFTLDDGVADADDTRYARVREFHATRADDVAAVGQDLRNHATLAHTLRERLVHDDEGFDADGIDEAFKLAATLTRPSIAPPRIADDATEPQATAVAPIVDEGAYALRNRLLRLLVERVALVRRAARRLFAQHPEVLQSVTSTYERERRAQRRKNAKEKGGASPNGATPGHDAPTG